MGGGGGGGAPGGWVGNYEQEGNGLLHCLDRIIQTYE